MILTSIIDPMRMALNEVDEIYGSLWEEEPHVFSTVFVPLCPHLRITGNNSHAHLSSDDGNALSARKWLNNETKFQHTQSTCISDPVCDSFWHLKTS